ncbi:hypothetical protein JB92DRAFT_2985625 [Gautieria morchelliformis]|nr:hypothetical protein JB92DRAFT_2985625 [Gautieria morchelliformis]
MNVSDSAAMHAQELLLIVSDARVSEYAILSSTALLYYDYVLTFSEEVDLVWRRRLNWGKVLFLLMRYFPLFAQTFNTAVYLNNTADHNVRFCRGASRFQFSSSSFILWLVELVLAVRVWILYGRSHAVLLGLGAVYAVCIATTTFILGKVFNRPIFQRPGPFLAGCYGPLPSYFFAIDIPPLITTLLLLTLTVYRTIQTMRCIGSLKLPPLMSLLLRDGILYFAAVGAVLTVNLLLFRAARVTLTSVATGFFIVIPSLSGTRLFLNVRHKLLHPGVTLSSEPYYEMRWFGPTAQAVEIAGLPLDDSDASRPPELEATRLQLRKAGEGLGLGDRATYACGSSARSETPLCGDLDGDLEHS